MSQKRDPCVAAPLQSSSIQGWQLFTVQVANMVFTRYGFQNKRPGQQSTWDSLVSLSLHPEHLGWKNNKGVVRLPVFMMFRLCPLSCRSHV